MTAEQRSDHSAGDEARGAVLDLLAARAPGATICPSEAARVVAQVAGAADWRDEMPAVHAAVEQLAAQGLVRLTWRGAERSVGDGPYRIARATPDL